MVLPCRGVSATVETTCPTEEAEDLPREPHISAMISKEAVSSVQVSSPEALFRSDYARLVRSLGVAVDDQEEARDAVQEAFVQAWKNWDKVGGYDDPAGWVRRVALNRLLNRRRALLRRGQALIHLSGRLSTPDGSPAEGAAALLQALAELPLKQRTALTLRYLGGYSLAEVADAMRVSEGTVSQHLHRGRESLRRSLEDER
jgi:RNA polymerase sigma-70 factor, ECF subfamily